MPQRRWLVLAFSAPPECPQPSPFLPLAASLWGHPWQHQLRTSGRGQHIHDGTGHGGHTCLTPAQGWAGSLHVRSLVSSLRLSMWSKCVESGVGAWGVSVNGMGLRTEGEPLLDTLAPPLWRREATPPESVVEGPLIQLSRSSSPSWCPQPLRRCQSGGCIGGGGGGHRAWVQ